MDDHWAAITAADFKEYACEACMTALLMMEGIICLGRILILGFGISHYCLNLA